MKAKFRAFDKLTKKWLGIGYHVIGETTMFDIIEMQLTPLGESKTFLERLGDVEESQFTSKLDKDGKEIYEGDIIQHPDRKALVEWDDGNCGWEFGLSDIKYWNEMRVIGNIYENPELLK